MKVLVSVLSVLAIAGSALLFLPGPAGADCGVDARGNPIPCPPPPPPVCGINARGLPMPCTPTPGPTPPPR